MASSQARFRVVVPHGAHGAPDTNWFPWLYAELEARGFEVIRPRLPTPQGQSLTTWLDAYDRAAGPLSTTTALVGHSLGVAFALRLVERATAQVAGLFLAAGFVGALGLPDHDPINASFFATPFDWASIRERGGRIRCWAGDNDSYVPLARSQDVADHLGAELEIVRGGGHLNSETGFTTFPQLRDALLNL